MMNCSNPRVKNPDKYCWHDKNDLPFDIDRKIWEEKE